MSLSFSRLYYGGVRETRRPSVRSTNREKAFRVFFAGRNGIPPYVCCGGQPH